MCFKTLITGKWPKDDEAVRRLRVAWLLEVAKALKKKLPGLRARMAGERLLLLQDGVVLRVRVGERGETSSECELTSWLAGVGKTYPAWSGAVRLALRWAAAHLLSCLPTTAVEVSVAAVLCSAPHPPTAATPAFLLWLSTLSGHDWNTRPLVVQGCETTVARAGLPPMAVLVPHSPSPSFWTRQVGSCSHALMLSCSHAHAPGVLAPAPARGRPSHLLPHQTIQASRYLPSLPGLL